MASSDPLSPDGLLSAESSSSDADNPAIAERVREGVRKAREKLIDLSMRNSMLNFRHSETSARHVRIVDEDLEHLVSTLAAGRAFRIIPLPPVEQVPSDEDSDAFRAALTAAKEIDLAAEDARRAAGNGRAKDPVAERALRDRVRAQLGMPEWRLTVDPPARAKDLGINPSYDLPPAGAATRPHRADQTLQTLFFADRLEPKLSKLHSAARALQEDAGLSALHCAVGFLEWYDPDDAPDPAFAPLVLLPINMEKRITNGEYVFSIAGRDDDETLNVALRERLEALGIDLPEYDPEKGIEAYLASVATRLATRPRWRVRRFATIGLFSFARQAMWSDLDSARWPATARPETHALLAQIYGDVAGDHTDDVAPIYDVDHPELEQQAPALVSDVDASQLSAVIDAASGKNLVIQGPPGTGKSQVITNIIANALWHGKTVLFVSEKMAALKVVKDRLDHMGLGLYCLEVHSAKASKTLVLNSIRERMQHPPRIANMQEMESAREGLRQARQRLTEYAALMNGPAGTTGLTTHQVLWGDFARSSPQEPPPKGSLDFRFGDPLSIDRVKLSELVGAGKALDDWSVAMGSAAEPANQPWRGIGNLNLNHIDRTRAIEVVARWADVLQRLLDLGTQLSTTAGWQGLISTSDMTAATKLIAEIPSPEHDVEETIVALASDDAARQSLGSWADLCIRAHDLEAHADAICPRQSLESDPDVVGAVLEKAAAARVASLPIEALPQACDDARAAAEQTAYLTQLIAELLEVAGRGPGLPLDLKAEAMAAGYLHAVHQLPSDYLGYRSSILGDDTVVDVLSAGQHLAQGARSAAAEAHFAEQPTSDLAGMIPPTQVLRHAADVLRTTSFFGRLFSRQWRTAKAVWRQTFREAGKFAPHEAAQRLSAAALWKDSLQKLEASAPARTAAGRHWNGVDTPFDRLIGVAEWMRLIRRVTPLREPGAKALRRLAFESAADDFAVLSRFAKTADNLNLLNAFQSAYASKTTIQAEAERLADRYATLQWLLESARQLELRPNQPIEKLNEARTALLDAKVLRQKMAQESVAVNACAAMPEGSERDKAEILQSTLRYMESVLAISLPASVGRYVLQKDCAVRVATLKQIADEMSTTVGLVQQAAAEDADQLLKLRPEEWCGGPLDITPISVLLQKCQRAVQAPDALEKQITLLSRELEATNLGLGDLVRCWTTEGRRYAGVAEAIEAAFYRSAAEKLMRENPVLTQHAGNTHEQVRKRFQELDRKILELNRQMIAAKLHARHVPPGRRAESTRDYTDHEMLAHQTELQQPIALRRLFSNAGDAIRAYTPCIMMSPMSVAQYLEPGKHSFDLLVIDEASQMRPEVALGAMLRCSQAIIVGDPQQLPPTDFFTALDDSSDPQAEDDPEESVFELGRRCWHPVRTLDIHYRSRHHSLIAYANREFYGERLLVYPSPVRDDPEFGVSCRNINGTYDAEQGRNLEEARAIAEEAATLMHARVDLSIGIVAINQAQRDLIETLIDQKAASDPAMQAYREKWSGDLEDFFIKNLENVQGDERDIILISTVYGRAADGVFHQHFGPIDRAYGHRRLNVLVTRAKRKLTVFTSLDHAQIVADGNRRGVRVLKEFLEYAGCGGITPGRQSGQQPESDFQRWFLSILKSAGYEAHPQVGVANYRLDIGVLHPDKPGGYILGIEGDGATYHSSKSARDRDRLRQEVLEGLNWRIHRLWSTDCYRDPEREFSRLVQNIERLRALH